MNSQGRTKPRSWITRAFLSEDEPRLRAGWRLLLHALLVFFILVLLLGCVLSYFFLTGEMPEEFDLVTMLPNFIAILLATWFARRFIDRRSFRSLGFHPDNHTLPDLIFGFTLAGLLMGLIFLSFWVIGWLQFEGWAWQHNNALNVFTGLIVSVLTFTLVGVSEEMLSRGYQLQNLKDGLNLNWAILLSSVLFAVLHLGNPYASWVSTLGLVAAGFFLAYGWVCTRQLWLPIGLHIGWNLFEGTVFGFSVSGLETFRLIHHSVEGPTLITGGAFGPEAGLIVLPIIILGALIIKWYTKARPAGDQKDNQHPDS